MLQIFIIYCLTSSGEYVKHGRTWHSMQKQNKNEKKNNDGVDNKNHSDCIKAKFGQNVNWERFHKKNPRSDSLL